MSQGRIYTLGVSPAINSPLNEVWRWNTYLILNSHYVAFVRKHLGSEDKDSWVLFNDEKVVKAVDVDEMKK